MEQFKEQSKNLNINEKKFTRLISHKDLSYHDEIYINYYYEEKQNLNFFYSIGLNSFLSTSMTMFLFRQNSGFFQTCTFGVSFSLIFLLFKNNIDIRFNQAIEPFYEKYKVK